MSRGVSAMTLVVPVLLWSVCMSVGRTSAAGAHASDIQLFVMPQSHVTPVLRLIRSARRSIRIEVYELTSRPIMNELAKARRRGVQVRVVLEEHPFGASRYAAASFAALRRDGVPVRWANESTFAFTHEKAMVVDDRTSGIFTFNLTTSGLYRNREFGAVDANTGDARTITRIFDADWRRAPVAVGSSGRLVVSPLNSRRALTALIDSAHSTLDVYAEEVDDRSIEQHLIRAAGRRVRVRFITSQSSAGVDRLRAGGVDVRLMPQPYVHAKILIADASRFFLGSENLTTTSLDRNRELGVELTDRPLASQIESTFSADWEPGTSVHAAPAAPTPGGPLSVSVSITPAEVRRGERLTITARTAPIATCSVRVTYPDGYVSRSRLLASSHRAGEDGLVTWIYNVGSTVAGQARAAVQCRLGNSTSSGSATFTIT